MILTEVIGHFLAATQNLLLIALSLSAELHRARPPLLPYCYKFLLKSTRSEIMVLGSGGLQATRQ